MLHNLQEYSRHFRPHAKYFDDFFAFERISFFKEIQTPII